ncbi:MAG: hypothetical protein J5855_10330 [Mailhella sp.]|nr:hypothetical protein [Mailhella sp.]
MNILSKKTGLLSVCCLLAALLTGGCVEPDVYTGYVRQPQPQYAPQPNYQRPDPPVMHGLPRDFQDFKARYASMGRTPRGAVKMYFDAVFSYIEGNKDEALKMIRYSMHEGKGWDYTGYHSTFIERLKDPRNHYIFRSFALGTSPQNNYAMDPNNYRLNIYDQREMHGYTQVQLVSSGSDSLRTVQVKRFDDGLWYIIQNAATYTQVREPYNVRAQKMYEHDADYDRSRRRY